MGVCVGDCRKRNVEGRGRYGSCGAETRPVSLGITPRRSRGDGRRREGRVKEDGEMITPIKGGEARPSKRSHEGKGAKSKVDAGGGGRVKAYVGGRAIVEAR